MKISTLAGLGVFTTVLVAGCGGGGSSGYTGVMAMTATSYNFVPPQANAQQHYVLSIVDNANNMITETITQTIMSVNSDGSYVFLSEDPSHTSTVVDGTTYSVPTETTDVNNSGQNLSYIVTASDGSQTSCTYNPHGNGPDYPLTVGAPWMLQYTLTCGTGSAVTYTQSGTIEDIESVTVAAGTFSALKLQSTLTWTNAAGTVTTQSITDWRDVVTQTSVKRSISWAYSGTAPVNGYTVTSDLELQSVN